MQQSQIPSGFNQVFYRANHPTEIEVRGFLCQETSSSSTGLMKPVPSGGEETSFSEHLELKPPLEEEASMYLNLSPGASWRELLQRGELGSPAGLGWFHTDPNTAMFLLVTALEQARAHTGLSFPHEAQN